MKEYKSGGIYKNEVDKPEMPMEHHIPAKEMGWEWAGDAADTAYGQAGESGCREDRRKIDSQFKNYNWK